MILKLNPTKTKVLLIGNTIYQDPLFENIPPAKNNLKYLGDILKNEEILGVKRHNVYTLLNETHDEIFEAINDLCEDEDVETLIIYYVGHGYKDVNKYYLTGTNSTCRRIKTTGINFDLIKEAIHNSKATRKILILDSCFSGMANARHNSVNLLSSKETKGTYVLASSSRREPSFFDRNANFTFFTNELIHLLINGIDNRKKALSMDDLYQQLRVRLTKLDLPEPGRWRSAIGSDMYLVKNKKAPQTRELVSDKEGRIGKTEPKPKANPVGFLVFVAFMLSLVLWLFPGMIQLSSQSQGREINNTPQSIEIEKTNLPEILGTWQIQSPENAGKNRHAPQELSFKEDQTYSLASSEENFAGHFEVQKSGPETHVILYDSQGTRLTALFFISFENNLLKYNNDQDYWIKMDRLN